VPEINNGDLPRFPTDLSEGVEMLPQDVYDDDTVAADADMLSTDKPSFSGALEPHEEVYALQAVPFPGLPDVRARTTVEERHYTADGLIEGPHPDRAVREAVDAERQRKMQDYDRVNDYLDKAPNLNSRYGAVIDEARAHIGADFGPEAADQSVTILSPEAAAEVFAGYGMGDGKRFFGRTVVRAEPQAAAFFGDRVVGRILLHEMAHGTDPNDTWVVTARPGGDDRRLAPYETVVGNYVVGTVQELGLRRPDPDVPPRKDFLNIYLEEGLVEAYAVAKQDAADPEWQDRLSHLLLKDVSMSHGDIPVTYANAGVPLVDPRSGTLAMPMKYLSGLYQDRTGISLARAMSVPAAYGLQLLEEYRLPGLQEVLFNSRINPARRPFVRACFNSIDDRPQLPPLYDRLSQLGYTSQNFTLGTLMIIDALGIGSEPVRK